MWVLFALGYALFAGATAILAKCGIRKTDSTVATAIRTIVVLIMSLVMVLIVGSAGSITSISPKTRLFLVLSGLATGASWLCYFRALQVGDINKVVPIDKSSTVLTILLAFIILGELISALKCVCVVLIAAGTLLMMKKRNPKKSNLAYLCGAFRRVCFAYLHTRQDRYFRCRIRSRHNDTHRGCTGNVLDDGICYRQGGQAARDTRQGACHDLSFRRGDRRFLAVLL